MVHVTAALCEPEQIYRTVGFVNDCKGHLGCMGSTEMTLLEAMPTEPDVRPHQVQGMKSGDHRSIEVPHQKQFSLALSRLAFPLSISPGAEATLSGR